MMKSETNVREAEVSNRMKYTSAPIVQQPASRFANVRFTRSYLFSLQGLLCSMIVLVQFAALVSAAAVPKLINNEVHLLPEFSSVRDAYLFFSITGLLFAIITLLFYTFNLVSVKPFNKLPLILIIIVIDIFWLISYFILAIMCAAKEESLKDPLFIYGMYINTGAFGSASFFGFASSLIYGVDAGFLIIKAMRGGLVT